MHYPTDRITHTTAFVTPVGERWLEREIAQWVHPMKDRSDDPPHHERTLYLWATSRSRKQCMTWTRHQTSAVAEGTLCQQDYVSTCVCDSLHVVHTYLTVWIGFGGAVDKLWGKRDRGNCVRISVLAPNLNGFLNVQRVGVRPLHPVFPH